MAARSLWFKIVSILVIFVLVSANSTVVRAQDATPPAPTQAPAAGEPATAVPTTPTSLPSTQIDASATPEAATETPLPDSPTQTPPAGEPATAAPTTPTSLPATQVEASATPAPAAETPLPQPPVGSPTQILPQATYSISGTVTGANGKGLPGVTVSADQDFQVQTAANGSYSLAGLAPGNHFIEAHLDKVNLVPFYRLVNVLDANVSGIDFSVPAQPLPVNASTQPMTVNYAHTLANNGTNSPTTSQGQISAQSAYNVGQTGTTYAVIPSWQIGQTGLPYPVEAVGAIAHLNAPSALAADGLGKLLEVEEHGNRLVRYSLTASDLVIGDKPGISYMDNYEFNSLTAVAVQPGTGHYWLGDSTRLVEYDPSQPAGQRFVSQFPATDPWVSGSDNGHFSEIRGIAFDTTGTVMFVSDRFNHRIQLYNIYSGKPVYIKTIGVSGVAGSDNAHFNEPWGIAFKNDILYVADSQNHRIQQCDPDSATCTTFASTSTITILHKFPKPPTILIVPFMRPTSISFNATNAFIADAERETVDECDLNGACVDFLGTPGATGTSNTQFNWPVSVLAIGSLVYVADQNNQRILGFTASDGSPYLQLGWTGSAYPDGGGAVYLNRPWGLAIDPTDPNNGGGESIYVGENWGYSLAKFDSAGNLLWRLPAYPAAYGSDIHHFGNFQGGNQGNLAIDSKHRLLVPDSGNNRVMVYSSSNAANPSSTPFILFGQIGSTWGSDNTHLACPQGVAVSSLGRIYVADTCNQRVQVFDAGYNYITTIGVTGQSGTDGNHFNQPVAVSIDNSTGDVYVADQSNDRVQKCHPATLSATSYVCTPFAGSTGVSGNLNFRYLNAPSSVLVDPVDQRVIVAEDQASRVQVFDMTGAYLTTLGGEWGDAGGRLRNPSGLAVTANGELFVADRENSRLLHYQPEFNFTQLNLNGFGEQFNGRVSGLTYYPAPDNLGPFTRMLYAITARTDGNPALPGGTANSPQVWRMLPDNTWQAVSAPGFGDPANTQLVDMTLYHNSLYVSTANNNGAQIWRCYNPDPLNPTNPCEKPSDWTLLPMPTQTNGKPSAHYTIAGRMLNFSGFLAVSLMSYYNNGGVMATDGGEVWLYDGNAGAWKTGYLSLDAGKPGGHALVGVQSMVVFNNNLIAGTNDWVNSPFVPAQVWVCTYNLSSGNCDWTKQLDFSTIDANVSAITSLMAPDNTSLYMGTTGANNTGASIYRCSTTWSGAAVMTGGNGDTNNSAVRAMTFRTISAVTTLFAVTSNPNGLNIFYSTSGNSGSWNSYLDHPGFGNGTTTQVDLDSSVIIDPAERLLVGTWNTTNGGALWASIYSNYNISGTITAGKTGLSGIPVILQPYNAQTTTVSGGAYNFTVPPGSYTIVPSANKYAFTPPSRVVNITNADASGVNFTAVEGDVPLVSPANGAQFASLDPVTLWWSTNGYASKFTLQVSTTSDFKVLYKNVTLAAFSFTLSGLKSNTNYYWKVRQAAPLPVGAWSATWSFRMPVPPGAPAQLLPASGAALPAGTFKPTFTWKPAVVPSGSAAVQHYQIQVSRLSTFTTLDLDENTPDAGTTYTVLFNLTGDRTYSWRLRAYNTVGDFGPWSSVRTFKTLPQMVLTGWMTDAHTLEPGFAWSDPQCVGKYLVQVYKGAALVKSATVTSGTTCQGAYPLTTSLLVNTAYQWRVTAQGTNGSGLPLINSFTTPASVPGVPVLLGPANNLIIPASPNYPDWQPFFTWQAVTSPAMDHYQIQIASQPSFGSSIFEDAPIPSSTNPLQYQVSVLLPYNASVYWRLRACDTSTNCSIWSTATKLVTRPGKPTNVTVGSTTLDTTIQWVDPGANPANSYSVMIYSNTTTPPTCITVWKTLTSTTMSTHILMSPGATYCIKVRGLGPTSSITGDYSDPAYVTTAIPPAVPVQSNPANAAVISAANPFLASSTPYTISFSWKPSTNATVYDLQVSEYSDFRTLLFDDHNLASLSQPHDFHAGTYYWRVCAGTAVGGAFSLWSAAHSFSTLGQVWGYIQDPSGNRLEGINVTVSGVTGSEDTAVGGQGFYSLANLSTGVHTIMISGKASNTLVTFLPQTRTITVAKGGYYYFRFVLAPKQDQFGVYRIVLTWNPLYSTTASLVDNLWLPAATPLHIINPNVGNADLTNAFPHAMEIFHDPWDGIEVIDVKPPQPGTYVFGVNQLNTTGTSWNGANAKVEVYSAAMLVKSCPQPSGSGAWWHAFDMNTSTVTCKNSISSTSPAPYPDLPITGQIHAQSDYHPLAGFQINYDYGTVTTDNYGAYTIPGIAAGSVTLTPQDNLGLCSTSTPFTPASPSVSAGGTQSFICNTRTSLSPGRLQTEAIQGDYAYIGANGWLYVVDISNKNLLTNLPEPGRLWVDGLDIQDVVVSGKYVYLASFNQDTFQGEVNVVDVSDPAHPTWVSSTPVEAHSLALYGQYLVVDSGVSINIYQQGPIPTLISTVTPGNFVSLYWVAVSGHYVYAVGPSGLYIYDIGDPAHPTGPWHADTNGLYFNLVVDGGYAYLDEDHIGSGDILILNVADPAHISQVADLAINGFRLEKSGDILYIADPDQTNGGLIAENVADPANSYQDGEFPINGTIDVKVQENYAFILDGTTGHPVHLAIVDETDPTYPTGKGDYVPAP
ncbi:MAG: carboxypeptidase regulatory-like domain-containing protein [Anaerolineaceae bacterium]|nr:carboxypeptidase regulatory-like domain-containing protein [Anaerolineaceae bacterium]